MEYALNRNPAVFKMCGKKKDYRNKDAVEKTIKYVFREDARKKDNLYGSIGTFNKSKSGIIQDFYKVKRLYDKEDGLQVKHFILSWGKRPDMLRKKCAA